MSHVQLWLWRSNRSFARPTRDEADAIRAALGHLSGGLSAGLVEHIVWSLDHDAPRRM